MKDILPSFVATPDTGMDNSVQFIADEFCFLTDGSDLDVLDSWIQVFFGFIGLFIHLLSILTNIDKIISQEFFQLISLVNLLFSHKQFFVDIV